MPRDLVRGRLEDGSTEANTSCRMWLYVHFLSSRHWQVNVICNKDRTRKENHFQMSNSSFCWMPGIDRMVLICLKLAFDLN